MIEAMTALHAKLSQYGTFYLEEAPTTTLPYNTYNLVTPTTTFETSLVELVIDLWDNDIVRLETLRKSVWMGLDRYTFTNSNIALSVRQISNIPVPDSNVAVYRRQLTFQVLLEGE